MERDEALSEGTRREALPDEEAVGGRRSTVDRRWVRPAVIAVVRRPHLWVTAMAQLGRMAAPGWWRRWPPLPLPDPDYLSFRLQTQYGDPDRPPEPQDLVTYLEWCRRFRRSMG